MCSPIRRRSILSISATTPLRSRTSGCSICRRLYASSWRVNDAARSDALRISSTTDRFASPGGKSRSKSCVLPRMAVSRLLKSWAMPPASWPTASIFWDCRNCSSRWRCSLTSRWVPQTRTSRPSSMKPTTLLRKTRGRPSRARSRVSESASRYPDRMNDRICSRFAESLTSCRSARRVPTRSWASL